MRLSGARMLGSENWKNKSECLDNLYWKVDRLCWNDWDWMLRSLIVMMYAN